MSYPASCFSPLLSPSCLQIVCLIISSGIFHFDWHASNFPCLFYPFLYQDTKYKNFSFNSEFSAILTEITCPLKTIGNSLRTSHLFCIGYLCGVFGLGYVFLWSYLFLTSFNYISWLQNGCFLRKGNTHEHWNFSFPAAISFSSPRNSRPGLGGYCLLSANICKELFLVKHTSQETWSMHLELAVLTSFLHYSFTFTFSGCSTFLLPPSSLCLTHEQWGAQFHWTGHSIQCFETSVLFPANSFISLYSSSSDLTHRSSEVSNLCIFQFVFLSLPFLSKES